MKTRIVYIALFFCMISLISCKQDDNKVKSGDFPVLKGLYLGQKPPGMIPELFAPNVISKNYHEHSFPAFSPDLKEVYWTSFLDGNYTYKYPERVLYMIMKEGKWSNPEYIPFAENMSSYELFYCYDGKKIFFTTDSEYISSEGESILKGDIFYVEKTSDGWSEAINAGENINTINHEGQATLTENMTMYYKGFLDGARNNYGLYRSKFQNGEFTKPELLPESISSGKGDWTPFIARDESYILFSSFSDERKERYGSGDIFVSFRRFDDTWTDAVNLGPTINEGYNERYPYVSPDGKYLFFLSDKLTSRLDKKKDFSFNELEEIYNNPGNGYCDIYWVSAKIIEDLKPENLK